MVMQLVFFVVVIALIVSVIVGMLLTPSRLVLNADGTLNTKVVKISYATVRLIKLEPIIQVVPGGPTLYGSARITPRPGEEIALQAIGCAMENGSHLGSSRIALSLDNRTIIDTTLELLGTNLVPLPVLQPIDQYTDVHLVAPAGCFARLVVSSKTPVGQ